MDAQELRNLQEAYMEVYEAVDDEGRAYARPKGTSSEVNRTNKPQENNRVQTHLGLIPRRNAEDPHYMREREIRMKARQAEAELERTNPEEAKRRTIEAAERRKRLAKTILSQQQKEQVDLYDIILSHLLDEGYAETPESAEAIMVNMSEEWRNSILG